MKTTRFRNTAIILGVLAMLGVAGTADARIGHYFSGYLNQEQAAKAQEMSTAHHAAMTPLMQQLYAKRAELDAQIYSATPNQDAIERLGKEIGALQGQVYAANASFNARLAKEGIPAGCWQNGRGMGYGRGGGHGGGWGGGHGRGWGGGHGGGHW